MIVEKPIKVEGGDVNQDAPKEEKDEDPRKKERS